MGFDRSAIRLNFEAAHPGLDPDHIFIWTFHGKSIKLTKGGFRLAVQTVRVAGLQLLSMLIAASFALLAFWFRDYLSLRMSPSRKATRRVLAYGAAILLAAVLLWTLLVRIGVWDFARRIESPPILFLLVAFHVGASVLSFWVKRTQSYNWMWATALIPAPIVWLLLLELSLLSDHGLDIVTLRFSFFGAALLWATSMFAAIFRTRHREMPLDDLDFVVVFGSLSHWLAICVLPIALFVLE